MKKLIALALVLVLVLSLAACGGHTVPAGKYSHSGILSETLLTFSGNKVTADIFIAGTKVLTQSGTYSLNDEETEITITMGETDDSKDGAKEANALNGTFRYSYDKDAGTVKIGSTTYTKGK
ncbi:MAG: hypothetical protein II794_06145 [Oscillospiraceae bacterium]|nr:hypothetical protein [Oscillospiraceae bacterium]